MSLRWIEAILMSACLSVPAISQTAPDAALMAALSQHRYADAAGIADDRLKTHPADARLWTLRGMALEGMGKPAEGAASYETALRIDPRSLPALKAAAQFAYQHHDARAEEYLKRLLTLKPDEPAAHAMAGVLAYESGNCSSATAEFEKSGELVENNEASATEFADCLMKQNRAAEAVGLLKKARAAHSESRNLQYDLAIALRKNHARDEALAVLRQGDGQDDSLLNLRASIEIEGGDYDAAFLDLRHAAELNPRDERSYIDMALLCLDHNQERRAVDVLTVAIEHLPKNAALYAIRGIAFAELSQYEKAQQDFVQASALDPNARLGRVAPTVLEMENNRPDKVKDDLRAQLQKSPNDPLLNTLLARLLLDAEAMQGSPEYAEAKQALARALKADSNAVEALVLQARIVLDENDPAGALPLLERAAGLDPDNRAALNQLLVVYRKLGRRNDMLRVVERLKTALHREDKQDRQTIRTEPARTASPSNR